MKTIDERQKRIDIVNEIILEISNRGRQFFRHRENVAQLFIRGNKVWYKCEYVPSENAIDEICLSIPDYRSPKGWYHGGTLMALVKDFKDYILNGGYTNHNNGYGGLFCTHWGYPPEDMKAIQDKAIRLGYLPPHPQPIQTIEK